MTTRNHGFSLVEMVIVVAVSLPILFAILTTSTRVSRTVNSSERNADTAENARKVAERVGRLLRSAHRTTFRVKATAADVSAGKAAAVGNWFDAPELQPRPGVQFRSASGDLWMNADSLTTPRELEFIRQTGEAANSLDDDGDGLVDEGQLVLRYGAVRTVVLDGVETCTFELDDQVMRFTMQSATRDADGNVFRVRSRYVWTVRN